MYKRIECVLEIEPNEHRIPRFLGKYSYHTHLAENTERPNSPNVLFGPVSRFLFIGRRHYQKLIDVCKSGKSAPTDCLSAPAKQV